MKLAPKPAANSQQPDGKNESLMDKLLLRKWKSS